MGKDKPRMHRIKRGWKGFFGRMIYTTNTVQFIISTDQENKSRKRITLIFFKAQQNSLTISNNTFGKYRFKISFAKVWAKCMFIFFTRHRNFFACNPYSVSHWKNLTIYLSLPLHFKPAWAKLFWKKGCKEVFVKTPPRINYTPSYGFLFLPKSPESPYWWQPLPAKKMNSFIFKPHLLVLPLIMGEYFQFLWKEL